MSIRPLKRQIVATEHESMTQKRQSKSMKTGIVSQTAERNEFRCGKIIETFAEEEVSHTSLTNDEEVLLIQQNRHNMKDKNILGLGIEERKVDGKKKDVLVFLVENGKKAHKIPEHVWLETKCGKKKKIATAVEPTGKTVPLRAEAGDAVTVVDPHINFGSTTIGAIIPFPNSDGPVRLLTSAHLIDYDERYKGKMLSYVKREDYHEQQPGNFLNPELELFPITNFYPVEKHDHQLTWAEEQMVTRNKFDVLWADVSFEVSENKITSRIAGRHPEGIRAPQRGEYINLYGLSSGMHRVKVPGTNFDKMVKHTHTEDRTLYYTYWEGLMRFKDENKPFLEGDSGSALVSDDGYVIGLFSFLDEYGYGYACQLQNT